MFFAMLKKLRVLLAVLFIVGITALFVDFTGTAIGITGWMAKVQFWPSVLGLDSLMGLNILVVLLLVLLTFIFGRIYCSVICPLGVMQDAFNRLGALRVKKALRRFRFAYAPEKRIIRWAVLPLCSRHGCRSLLGRCAPLDVAYRAIQHVWTHCRRCCKACL